MTTYYQARFQIEFIFRDAKQFTGLCDAQTRKLERLDYHRPVPSAMASRDRSYSSQVAGCQGDGELLWVGMAIRVVMAQGFQKKIDSSILTDRSVHRLYP
jgi:hypothetical protein